MKLPFRRYAHWNHTFIEIVLFSCDPNTKKWCLKWCYHRTIMPLILYLSLQFCNQNIQGRKNLFILFILIYSLFNDDYNRILICIQ